MLTVGDIKKEAAVFVNELQTINGTDFLFHELFTNGIGYLRLMFKLDKVPERLFPYLGILKGTLMLSCLTKPISKQAVSRQIPISIAVSATNRSIR